MTREMKMVARLYKYTTEYRALEVEKETYYRKNIRNIDRTTIHTLYLMQEHVDTLVKQICMLVDRLNRNQIDFDNEVAEYVYNTYASSIRRGFFDI